MNKCRVHLIINFEGYKKICFPFLLLLKFWFTTWAGLSSPKVEVTAPCLQLARKLEEELNGWLGAAGLTKSPDVRAVIAP